MRRAGYGPTASGPPAAAQRDSAPRLRTAARRGSPGGGGRGGVAGGRRSGAGEGEGEEGGQEKWLESPSRRRRRRQGRMKEETREGGRVGLGRGRLRPVGPPRWLSSTDLVFLKRDLPG